MFAVDVRTMDLKDCLIAIQRGEKESLKQSLLRDYKLLKDKYFDLHLKREIYWKIIECMNYLNMEEENYQDTINSKYPIWGKVRLTADFDKNIIIANKVRELNHFKQKASKYFELEKYYRLKLQEVYDCLVWLDSKGIKNDYKAFESKMDEISYEDYPEEYKIILDDEEELCELIYDEDCDIRKHFCKYELDYQE